MSTHVCHRCDGELPLDNEDYPTQIRNGLTLDIRGSYGMFTDLHFPSPGHEEDHLVKLCHDCCVGLFEYLGPGLPLDLKGCHPSPEEGELCCKWGWRPVRGDDGEWDGSTVNGGGWQA
jgi:hypothetical protein